jgi:histidyl-tRNA synthetase
MGDRAQNIAFESLQALRLQGIRAEMDFENRSLKSQMRRANKLGASFSLIVGERELDENAAVLRNMETKEQEKIPLHDLVGHVVGKIKG